MARQYAPFFVALPLIHQTTRGTRIAMNLRLQGCILQVENGFFAPVLSGWPLPSHWCDTKMERNVAWHSTINLPSSAPELKELKGFLGNLKVVKHWDDSNWEWLQRLWNRQLEWVRLVTTGYPKWICVEIGESFTAPQIYGHKLIEACWQTNRFSDKPKSAGWPMYSKNAKSTFFLGYFFLRGTPWKALQTVAWACHELHTFAGFQGIIPATSYCKICLSI